MYWHCSGPSSRGRGSPPVGGSGCGPPRPATAAPFFRVVSSSSGRLDYIETIRQWRLRFARFGWRKLAAKAVLLPRFLGSADFRHAFASGISPNGIAFERELLDHYRIVFEAT